MTPLTDTEITTLLRTAFAAREAEAGEEAGQEAVRRAVGSARTVAPHAARRRRLLLVAASAAALGLGGAVVATLRPAGEPLPGARPVVDPRVLTASDDANREAARGLVEDAVLSLTMPAGADELPRGEPLPSEAGPGVVTSRSRYWVVPGTLEAVAAAVTADPPPGFLLRSTGSGSAGGRVVSRDVELHRDLASPVASGVDLSVRVSTAEPGKVRVLAVASAWWRPARDPASVLRDPLTGVDVVVRTQRAGGAASTSSAAHLGAEDAARLASVVNGELAEPGQAVSCPAARVTTTTVLTFRSGSGDVVVEAQADCPWATTVSRDGRVLRPALEGGQGLAALAAARVRAAGGATPAG